MLDFAYLVLPQATILVIVNITYIVYIIFVEKK